MLFVVSNLIGLSSNYAKFSLHRLSMVACYCCHFFVVSMILHINIHVNDYMRVTCDKWKQYDTYAYAIHKRFCPGLCVIEIWEIRNDCTGWNSNNNNWNLIIVAVMSPICFVNGIRYGHIAGNWNNFICAFINVHRNASKRIALANRNKKKSSNNDVIVGVKNEKWGHTHIFYT